MNGVDLPIVHFSELKPPVICCVALGRTGGVFEANVKSMNWKYGRDYWFFNSIVSYKYTKTMHRMMDTFGLAKKDFYSS